MASSHLLYLGTYTKSGSKGIYAVRLDGESGALSSPLLVAEAPDPESRRTELVARQPLGRLATPVEIAKAVLYVASDDASFITGSELVIDGGITAA